VLGYWLGDEEGAGVGFPAMKVGNVVTNATGYNVGRTLGQGVGFIAE